MTAGSRYRAKRENGRTGRKFINIVRVFAARRPDQFINLPFSTRVVRLTMV
jgi:hypothetical protein